jgi:hypothetical protein
MSRWSETYKARAARHDNVDIVDNMPPPVASPVHSVNNVNNVTVTEKENEAASDAAFEAVERAAIIAESEHGNAAAPVPHRLPPSWADASIIPTAGARCHCCKGARWWCEAAKPSGWRCAVCHPPGHLAAGRFREVMT